MGVEHRKAVERIPAGLMHPDEKQVLYVLATETNDARLEWGHDRAVLLDRLGLHDDRAGRKWLQRRLRALEDAGWIQRRPQPRLNDGSWGWSLIRLRFRDMGHWFSVEQYLEDFTPTPRARDRRRPNYTFTDDDRARAREVRWGQPDSQAGGQTESTRGGQTESNGTGQVESTPSSQLRATSPVPPDANPDRLRTIAPDSAETEEPREDPDLEARKQDTIDALNTYSQSIEDDPQTPD